MKCTDCKGSGSYQGLGPIETCSRCNGTGVEPGDTKLSGQRAEAFIFDEGPSAWDDARSTPIEDFAKAKQVIRNLRPPPFSDPDSEKRKAVNRTKQVAFQQKADAAIATLYDKYVDVYFKTGHPQMRRGRITGLETFGPYIQEIELTSPFGVMTIPMLDIEKILNDVNSDQLWPGPSTPASAPPTTTTVVSTVIAGTAVKTGDSVDVTTNNAGRSARYVGVLKAIKATTIEVEGPIDVDIIPINVIDQLKVTSPVTHAAPPGSAINYASPNPIDPAEAARLRKLDEDGFLSHRLFPNEVSKVPLPNIVYPKHDWSTSSLCKAVTHEIVRKLIVGALNSLIIKHTPVQGPYSFGGYDPRDHV